MTLPRSAEVLVVGGGVTGVSAAYHLARSGATDVVLVERETLGAGSTSRSAGGIRTQFSDELNVSIGIECVRRFERFHDETGVDIGFRQWGYLFLVSTEDDLRAFRRSVELQQRLGVPSVLLTPDEALQHVPQLHVADLAGATYCRLDGHATPEAVVQGYAQRATQLGVTLVQGCAAERIGTRHGRVISVDTSAGRIDTPTVICAAGVWSRELAATAGVDLPVTPERRYVFVTEPGDPLPPEIPLTVDFSTGFYVHREGPALLLGGRETTIEALAPAAVHRLPAMADLRVRASWHGYYEMSPDHNAIVGRTRDPDGLIYATGFSGHGFQQCPVVGEHLAELALGLVPSFDLSPFSVERFARSAARPEHNVI